MINKINLLGSEIIEFIFSGTIGLIVITFLVLIWKSYLPSSNNWMSFTAASVLVTLVNGGVLIFLFKDVRDLSKKLFSKSL